MRKRRRLALQCSSDDDDDDDGSGDNAAPEAPETTKPTGPGSSRPTKKQQQRRRADDEDGTDLELVKEGEDENELEEMRRDKEEEEEERREDKRTSHRRDRKPERPVEESGDELEEKAETDEEEEEDGEGAVPIGDPVRVTGKGSKTERKHYDSFEYEGNTYELGDSVMFTPAQENEKPYVGIIKDINESDGSLSVTSQWFYRPEEAEKDGGDPRKLFYSFHVDEVPAESVMHTCTVHFIPHYKQIPCKKERPGFIVQQVYDHIEEKLWNITDKDYYQDNRQHEVDLLVQKTLDHIGELPDRDPEDIPGDNTDHLSKRGQQKRPLNPEYVSRDAPTGKSDQLIKAAGNENLKNYAILVRNKAVTGEECRDRWLDRFVDTILATKDNENSYPPDLVVKIVASLEGSTFEALCADFQKYNQKMRTLEFNIKNSSILRRRLMNKELDPPVLLTMAPDELKAGLAPADKTSETEEPRQLQMTNVQCKRCTERIVGIIRIIHASRGDRYELECISCGFTRYAPRDDIVLASS